MDAMDQLGKRALPALRQGVMPESGLSWPPGSVTSPSRINHPLVPRGPHPSTSRHTARRYFLTLALAVLPLCLYSYSTATRRRTW